MQKSISNVLGVIIGVVALSVAIQAQQLDTTTVQAGVTADVSVQTALASAMYATTNGGSASSPQDFTIQGILTRHVAGEDETCSMSVSGLGGSSIRTERNCSSEGKTHAVVVGPAGMASKDGDDKSKNLPSRNRVALGLLNMPFTGLAALTNDQSFVASTVENVTINGLNLAMIHFQAKSVKSIALVTDSIPEDPPPFGFDVYLDATTKLIAKVHGKLNPPNNSSEEFDYELEFGDYRSEGGLMVPHTISERFTGQPTWEFKVNSFTANNGLTDLVFKP